MRRETVDKLFQEDRLENLISTVKKVAGESHTAVQLQEVCPRK